MVVHDEAASRQGNKVIAKTDRSLPCLTMTKRNNDRKEEEVTVGLA